MAGSVGTVETQAVGSGGGGGSIVDHSLELEMDGRGKFKTRELKKNGTIILDVKYWKQRYGSKTFGEKSIEIKALEVTSMIRHHFY